jgi:hypothetical protein
MKSTIFWVVMLCNSVLTGISEECIASIFRVDKQAKQETSKKLMQAALCWFLA